MNNIDILEELIRDYKDEKEFVGEEIIKAIETLIAENKELKEEIEELKEKFSDEKIRNTVIKRYREVIEKDYISKDKIKAKIEELQKEKIEMTVDIINHNTLAEIIRDEQINILQSLLEKE